MIPGITILDMIRIIHMDILAPEDLSFSIFSNQVAAFLREAANKLISDMLILLWD